MMARPTPELDRLRAAERDLTELRKIASDFFGARSQYAPAIERAIREELDREWRTRRDAFEAELDRLDIPGGYRSTLAGLLARSARYPWGHHFDEGDIVGLLEHNFLGMTPHAFAATGFEEIRREIRLRLFRARGHRRSFVP